MKKQNTIEIIGEGSRTMGGSDFFFLWAGAAVSLAEIWAGGLLAPLGFSMGILVIIVGHLIGNTPLALGGIIGSKTGFPSMVAIRPSFGKRGSYFGTLLNLVQLIGWTGVMLWIGGKAAESVWPMPFLGFRGWILVAGITTTIWAAIGHRHWKWLHRIAVTALIALSLIMTYIILREYEFKQLLAFPPQGSMPFMLGLDLVIAMPVSWLPLVSDYSRYGKRTTSTFWGTWIGYFVISSWMFIIGLAAAIATNTSVPDSMVLQLMVSLGLILPAIIIVLFSTITTTFLDIYSTSVSALNIWPGLGEKKGSILFGITGTVLALMFPATAYENFLLLVGSVFCPLFGVVLADYFILRKQKYFGNGIDGEEDSYWYKGDFNPWAFTAWGLGFGLYLLLQRNTVWGSSAPSFLAAGLIYLVLMSLFSRSQGSQQRDKGESK